MIRSLVRKWFCYGAAAYLALATMGTFVFMSLDDVPYFEDLPGKVTEHRAFLTDFTYPIECLVSGNAKDLSFSPLRQCLPRVMPVNFFTAGAGLLCAALRLFTRAAAYNIKNTILLKLRI
jgi:hypothetical protein